MSGLEWFLLIVVVIAVPLIVAVVVTMWTLEQARQQNRKNRPGGPGEPVKRNAVKVGPERGVAPGDSSARGDSAGTVAER